MGKRGVLAVITLLLLLSISFSLVVFAQSEEPVDVDPFVESALTVAPEVNVIIVLKEPDILVSEGASSEVILEETKDAVEEVTDEFLNNIPEEAQEFGVVSDETPINITQTYETINVVAATVTQEGLEDLRNNPAVEEVILEPIFHVGLIDSVPLVNANDVHNLSVAGTKLNGTGMIACVLDSGIELNHSAFTGRILPGYDFVNSDNSSDDDMANSHGTHVSGTIAGLTVNGTGVAPAAQLIPIKVCNSTGGCSGSAILSGIDYCNNLTSTYNISVLSMSISDGGQYNSTTCPTFFDSGLTSSNSLGVIPVMASGNDYYTGGISYPACSPYTISVGSSTKAGAMSSFTNRGGDMLDILAPGSSIISTIRGNTAGVLSGTSMATPHVSGLVLLMQQNELLNGRSELNLSQVRSVLQQTGVPISGYQRIDAYNAITKLNYNYTINNSGRKVSYQAGSESSQVTFDNSTDFSNFAECASLGANFVYVNSSSCSQFNKSASIEFTGIVASNVSVIRDGAACGAFCTSVNFSGGVLTFNVSSFSNYSYEVSNSSNGSGSNVSIMNVTAHYNLTGDYNGSIHLLSDNIVFDCAGFVISAGSEPAIRADGRTNVTIRNCVITGTTDILFNGTSSSTVQSVEGNGSLIFANADNNVIDSAQISSNGTWISADSSSTGNVFVNLTIENNHGSIDWVENLSVPSNTAANQTNLRIQEGNVFLNSSQLGWMNETAQITLTGLTPAYSSAFSPAAAFSQVPIIDENDNGTFTVCPEDVCNQTEYSANSLTFVTQHFTTINSTTSFPVSINDSSTLVQNISVNGSAITFNNNSISLDCLNNVITGSSTGVGITITSKNNVTVRNCKITGFDYGLRMTTSDNVLVRDNFFTNSTSYGFRTIYSGTISANNSVINNTANTSSIFNTILIEGTQTNLTFANNTAYNSIGAAIQLNIVSNSFITNNTAISNTTALDLTSNQNNIVTLNNAQSINGQGLVLSGSSPQSSNNTLINNTLSSANNYALFLSSNTIQTTVVNSTLSGSIGVGISGSNMNNNIFNNTFMLVNSSGLDVGFGASNASLFNTTIESNNSWIRYSAPLTLTNISFTQTTFTTANGSIYIPGNFTFPNGTFLNKTNLDILLDRAYVNTSNVSYLNQSAQITLVNSSLSFIPGGLSVDFNDDGTFTQCAGNVCTFVSQNSTRLVFNVSHFTSYSSNSTFPATVNESSNLTSNITVNGSAFIINASNIVFDCLGFRITGNGTGTGIDASGMTNVTIQNCNIVNFNRNILFSSTNNSAIFNTSTSNSTQENIEFTSSNNNRLNNITAQGNASSYATINLTGGQGNNLTNINSSSVDTIGAGAIALDGQTQNNSLTNITATGTNSAIGVLINQQSNNNTLTNITATTDANAAVYIENSNLTRVLGGNLTGNSQPGLYLGIVQNLTLSNLTISSSSGFGADLANVQNSSFTNINLTSSTNEALRTSATNRNDFTNIIASSPSNPSIRVTGSNNLFTNITTSSTSSVALLVISSARHNRFIGASASSSSSLGLSVSLSSDNNSFENSTFASNTLRAISLVSGVQNNTFRNITIFSNATWIHADADSPSNNFTNATFESSFGRIKSANFTMGNGSTVGTSNLSITQNKAFINSSLFAFLNASSQITLNNATSNVMLVDLEDDNVFSVCNPPRCSFQSFSGSQIVFNVTSFTSYSTSQGGVGVALTKADSPDPVGSGQQLNYTIRFNVTNGSAFNITINETYPSGVTFHNSTPSPTVGNTSWSVGNLTANETYQINITVNVSSNASGTLTNIVNATYANSSGSQFIINVTENTTVQTVFPVTITTSTTLTQNATVNGSAYVIGADNITLDCAGFTITGNGSGTGVNATGRNNITIRNCIIVNFNQNLLLSATNNSFVLNNSLFNASLENIEFVSSNNNLVNILSGIANSTGSPFFNISGGNNNTLNNMNFNATSTGLSLDTGTENNTVSNSTIIMPASGVGIAVPSDRNNFTNITATSLSGTGSGMTIQGGRNNIILSSNISSTFIAMAITLNGDANSLINSTVSGTSVGLQLNGLTTGASVQNTSITNSIIHSSSGTALQFGFNVSRNNITNSNITSGSSSGVTFTQDANLNIIESSIITTSAGGVRFETNASNNTLSNTTINDTATWLYSDGNANVNNTLRNVSFLTSEGKIKTILATLPNSTTVSTSNLDITQNKAFLNSSNLSFLNVSSQVTLNSINSRAPYVDFNDDNVFEVCNPPQCVVESFNGSTAVFNVSSFTSYSTSSSGNVTVSLSKSDSTNTVGPGDIFTYQINYTVSNGTSFNTTIQENYPSELIFINATPAANASNNTWFAQNLTEGSTFQINITVQVNGSVLSSTTINNTVNVSFANSTGSIFNVNVSETTSIVVTFPVTVTTNTTLTGNVSVNGSAFVFNTSGVTFNCNGSSVIGSGSGVAFNITNASNVSIINCRAQSFTSDVLLFNSTFANITNTTLVTPTTWLSADSTSNATLNNLTFQNGQGSLTSLAQIVVPGNSNINNVKVSISSGDAFVNSTNLSFLNTSFQVRLDNLGLTNTTLLADYNDDSIFQLCTVCTFVSYNGSTLIFNVAHFTTYTAVEGGVNFTVTKTASPDPVTPGSQVTYTITVTVNSGFAHNITVVESPPSELTFVSSSPTNTSANTWILQNLTTGESAQINVTYAVNSSFTGTINNTINVSLQNNTNGTITTQVNSTSTAAFSSPASQGGGGGGGSSSVICPPLCSDPLNKNLAICRNNCPQPTEQVAAPISFPELPITKESSSSEQIQEKESVETQEIVEQAPSVVEEVKVSEEEINKSSIVSSPAFKFGLPLVLGIALLVFILSRLPRHPKDKFSSELRRNEQRIRDIERQLKK